MSARSVFPRLAKTFALSVLPILIVVAENAPKTGPISDPNRAIGPELQWKIADEETAAMAVAVSPNGESIVTGGSDGSIHFWNTAGGKLQGNLEGHRDAMYSIVYLPDGLRLISASLDGNIAVWGLDNRRPIRTLHWPARKLYSCNLAVTRDGKTMAAAAGPEIRLWSVDSGAVLRTIQVEEHNVVSISISPDGSRLASGDGYANIHIWEIETGRDLQRLDKPGTTAVYASDAPILATRDPAGKDYVWREIAQPHRTIELAVKEPGSTSNFSGPIAFSSDGRRLATVVDSASIDVYNVRDGMKVSRFAAHTGRVTALEFLPDGRLVSAGLDGRVFIWSAPDG